LTVLDRAKAAVTIADYWRQAADVHFWFLAPVGA
jgi:hypothetical protein